MKIRLLCFAMLSASVPAHAALDIPIVPVSTLIDASKETSKDTQEEKSKSTLIPKSSEKVKTQFGQEVSTEKTKIARSDKELSVETVKYPSKEVRANVPKQDAVVAPPSISAKGEAITNSKAVIEMEPGVAQLVTISKGHPNRIVTPFSTPKVLKIDKGTTIKTQDNVLYVATNSNSPVTLYIREEGSEQVALSLTLIPKRIPARELFLKVKNSDFAMSGFSTNAKAKRWEESGDYNSKIKRVNRALALSEIPNGYVMRRLRSTDHLPSCEQNGLEFDFTAAQVIDGHHMEVIIGTFTNSSKEVIELVESNCGTYGVRSVSAWPEVVLHPGQTSEIYITRSQNTEKRINKQRPSLIGGRF